MSKQIKVITPKDLGDSLYVDNNKVLVNIDGITIRKGSNGELYADKEDILSTKLRVFNSDGTITIIGGEQNLEEDRQWEVSINSIILDKINASYDLRHEALTLGTTNGLSINEQILSLNLATTEASGAMSSTDKIRLEGLENYIHPTYTTGNQTLSGATVVDYVSYNNGHITSLTSRTLTLDDLGYTAYILPTASDIILGGVKVGSGLAINGSGVLSNTYTHPTQTAITVTATGFEVLNNVVVDTYGHVTSFSKRTLPNATTSVSGILTSTDWNTFNNKQSTLVSATNIKTINGTSILGSGDLVIAKPIVRYGASNFVLDPDITFAATGDTTISFDTGTRTLTIDSTVGAGGGTAGVTTFNGRYGVVLPATGDYNITSLGDVNITSILNNQILQYKTASSKFVNIDLNTSNVSESTNLYYTDARARTAISLAITRTSGTSTYTSGTGVFDIPNYTLAGLGGQASSAVLTSIATLSAGTGLLKLTSGVATLDTNVYLTSYTETDPIHTAWLVSNQTKVDNGQTAFGWGNHTLQNYLTSATDTYATSASLSGTTVTFVRNNAATFVLDLSGFDTRYSQSVVNYWTKTGVDLSYSTGNVGIGTPSPSQKLHVDGSARVTGAYYDSGNTPGIANQLLASTATGTAWIDQSTIVAEAATLVVVACKNTSGATIAKGTPVYQTGTVGSTATIEIAPADALISANKLPAIGLLQTDLNNNGFGNVVISGELTNFTTDPIDGLTPTVGDKIFVKSGGGLTLTKPTGEGNGIQNMGLVGKVSGGGAGSITVSSIMRTNDVPNLPEGRIWVGDGNTIVSNTVYVDEPNNRVGIGNINPAYKLDVNGSFGATSVAITGLTTNYLPKVGTAGLLVNSLIYDNGTNIGIGTTSPAYKLDVDGNARFSNSILGKPSLEGALIPTVYNSHTGFSITADANYQKFVVYGYNYGSNPIFQVAAKNYTVDPSAAWDETGTVRFTVTASGNVGIGTTNPTVKLDVVGQIKSSTLGSTIVKSVAGVLTDATASDIANILGAEEYIKNQNASAQTANLWITGNGTFNGVVTASSDIRIKTELKVEKVLNKLDNINLYSYYKNKSVNKQYGLIAQEVEKQFPYLINETKYENYNDFKSIDLYGVAAIAIQGVKEVKSEVDVLKERVLLLEQTLEKHGITG